MLLLHGTGGNEDDLIPIGRELAPNFSLLSPRGKVLEGEMPRFFKRLAEGVFDIQDLEFRTKELSNFVQLASRKYDFDSKKVIAVGYSNGANIAASMLFIQSEILLGAILFRAMVPFLQETHPNLSGKSIFLSAGKYDPIIKISQVDKLRKILQASGAKVTMNLEDSDHSLTREEIRKARDFLQEHYISS